MMINIAKSTCAYCERRIVADLDERSTLDWGDNGDYGCDSHPLNSADGTYGHQPYNRNARALTDEVRGLFNEGARGAEYVAQARRLAKALRVDRIYSGVVT